MKKMLLMILCACCMTACSYELLPTKFIVYPAIHNYKYVHIASTGTKTGGYISGYSSYIGGIVNSTTPSDIIAGVLMNKGYIILPQIEEDKKDLTLVVSYGETQHRTIGLFSYAIGVNIQFRDAKTFELIASSEAEGIGSTEADDVRNAVNKALHSIFANAEANFYTKH